MSARAATLRGCGAGARAGVLFLFLLLLVRALGAGRSLGRAFLRGRRVRLLGRAIVGGVETRAFQDDADRVENTLELASADLADLERGVAEPLHRLEAAAAFRAGVF